MLEEIKRQHKKLVIKEEKFQKVNRDGLRVFGLTQLQLQFKRLYIEHPVGVVDKIAHKFILRNDFLVRY